MPRTGFVWPIMEPEATGPGSDQQSEKRKGADETGTASSSSSRKQQNHFLLFNAMRTTAAHSSATFVNNTRPVADPPPATETAPLETVVERARSVSVAPTPAPPLRRSSTPRVTGSSQSLELGKGLPGAPGVPPKRKKKRECIHDGFWGSVRLTRTCIAGTNTAGNTPAPN
jgi:mediator of RNA polymerase II transcription subunit 6